MKAATRTVALIGGAVVVLAAPLAFAWARSEPPDPRLSIGAAAPATLIPGDVHDPAGRMIAGAVWTGLVAYDPSGTPVNAAAAAITSRDRRIWTIRLKPGGRFHDGSPVTAASFTGAWTAVVREGWHGAHLFTEVARVRGATAKSGPISGLKARDTETIEVALDRPLNGFPALLADPAFMPMPASVLRSRDWGAYGRAPVGNGPFRVREQGAGQIILSRPTGRPAQIVVRAMPAERQYAAVRAGDLDIATRVPGADHDSMDADFPRRHRTVPGRTMTYLAFPMRDRRFAATSLRHAISLAIDRAAAAEGPLGHGVTPATSLVPPGITLGRRDAVCRICVQDAKAAAALLADAGGLAGPLTLTYAPGDEGWLAAVAQQLRSALKIDVRLAPSPALPDTAHPPDQPFVVRATGAYPSATAALAPLLATPTGHRDPYTADQIGRAERATRLQDGVIPARLAESALLRDLPLIPLWSAHEHLVWSERTRGVTADAFGGLRLDRIRFAD